MSRKTTLLRKKLAQNRNIDLLIPSRKVVSTSGRVCSEPMRVEKFDRLVKRFGR